MMDAIYCFHRHFWLVLTVALVLVIDRSRVVEGHGRMIEPPMRSSMWRAGYPNPPAGRNYNDNELFCGGAAAIKANGGRCGECGDDWKMAQPRPNEEGGGYFIGRTVRYYSSGALIPITIEMTAVHNGYFEFRLCTEKKTINELVTQQCLDKNLLRLADGTTRFTQVTTAIKYTVNVQLPPGVSCQFCVIQWRYVTDNGTGEEYKNCADVAIA